MKFVNQIAITGVLAHLEDGTVLMRLAADETKTKPWYVATPSGWLSVGNEYDKGQLDALVDVKKETP